MCVLLDNPQELAPCSENWRSLMAVCSSNTCAEFASFAGRAPPVSSCTNTPAPLPGGTGSAGFSFGSWDTITTNATSNRTGTGGQGGPKVTTSPTGGSNSDSSSSGQSGGVRTIIGTIGMGWLWEMVFLFWGIVW
ncbi:unnamed protein product, partial [Tuber aestivum]